MASKRLRALAGGESEPFKTDMSPMIDMVFLLLIFFMVTSRLIVIRQDKSVEPSVALESKPLAEARGRVVINLLDNGTIKDINGKVINLTNVENLCRTRKEVNERAGVKTKLHIRADRRTDMREVKKVVTAGANAGVIDVVFATYRVNKYND
ncbi:MAG: biopolymer transporter ExbD [Verrucomicrobiales bacterium]|nr:biopolymer transporter ExbD [Verrucomicrobiales bacterium]